MENLQIPEQNNFTQVLRQQPSAQFDLSLLISSYKRLPFIRRTLYSINKTVPPINFEVIISEEESSDTPLLLDEIKKYKFPTTIILSGKKEFEEATGLKHYHNNAVLTYNIGLLHCSGKTLGVLGNDIIITEGCVQQLLNEAKLLNAEDYIIYTTTYNCLKHVLAQIGEYGEKLNYSFIKQCSKNVMQNPDYKTIVNNYLSICPLSTMFKINGWDYTYFESIAAEDSDVSRRIFAIPNSKSKFSSAISLHQEHPSAQFDTSEQKKFWDDGVAKARRRYHSWDGSYYMNQDLNIGKVAIRDILKLNY